MKTDCIPQETRICPKCKRTVVHTGKFAKWNKKWADKNRLGCRRCSCGCHRKYNTIEEQRAGEARLRAIRYKDPVNRKKQQELVRRYNQSHKEYWKKYYQEHKQKLLDYQTKYRKDNHKEVLRKNRKYARVHSQEISKRNREIYKQNREEILKRGRERYRIKHPKK